MSYSILCGSFNSHTYYGKCSSTTYGKAQTLSVSYDGYRPKSIEGSASYARFNTLGFQNRVSDSQEYVYDSNGNMIQDANKGISFIKYNILNLPEDIQMQDGHRLHFSYDALGRKHRMRSVTLMEVVDVPMGTLYDTDEGLIKSETTKSYCSNLEYHTSEKLKKSSLAKIRYPDGYSLGAEKYFQIKDHLGNVRSEVSCFGIDGMTRYYPWGLEYDSRNIYGDDGMCGKELITQHGVNMYDSEARYYDMAVGTWWSMDPLAEKYYSANPYVYCGGDPVRFVDPDGKSPKDRIYAARNFYVGKPYAQESGLNRTAWTAKALTFMDCSELVTRVLIDDEMLNDGTSMSSAELKNHFENSGKYEFSETANPGDIAVWDGHVGIVSDVGVSSEKKEENTFKMIHARGIDSDGRNRPSKENANYIVAKKYKSSKFIGFFRPKEETPDNKFDRIYDAGMLPEVVVNSKKNDNE